MGDALTDIDAEVKKMGLAPGYTTGVTGMGKMFAEMMGSFKLAFLISIIGMYMVLAAQFESFLHPITIMLALPLAIPFALLSLWLTDQFLAIFSILGVLLLFGIVKKNAILQVDHTINLRAKGLPRDEAILTANRERSASDSYDDAWHWCRACSQFFWDKDQRQKVIVGSPSSSSVDRVCVCY